jgi:hypothetical protein
MACAETKADPGRTFCTLVADRVARFRSLPWIASLVVISEYFSTDSLLIGSTIQTSLGTCTAGEGTQGIQIGKLQ